MTWKKMAIVAAVIVVPLGGLALAAYLAVRRLSRW